MLKTAIASIPNKYAIAFNIIVLIFLLFLANYRITNQGRSILEKDASDNVLSSFYLAKYGMFSLDGETPTYFREPLDGFVSAFHIAVFTDLLQTSTDVDFLDDKNAIVQLTRVNLFYLVLLYLAGWWLVFQLTQKHHYVVPVMLFPLAHYIFTVFYITNFTNDFLASGLFTLSIAALLYMLDKPTLVRATLFGLILGLCVLTKAAMLYIGIGFFILFPVLLLIVPKVSKKLIFKCLAISALGFVFTIAPWMVRNAILFDDLVIAQRGGAVLLIRAVKNEMNWEEKKATIFFYTPKSIQRIAKNLKIGPNEDEFYNQGKYHRLNRDLEQDIKNMQQGNVAEMKSYYRKAKHTIPDQLAKKLGPTYSPHALDSALKKESITRILNKPMAHLSTTPVFAWRGFWAYKGDNIPFSIINAVTFLGLFFGFAKGVVKRDLVLISISLLAVLFFGFHAFLTHFIPRYSAPLIPISAIVTFTMLLQAIQKVKVKKSSGPT